MGDPYRRLPLGQFSTTVIGGVALATGEATRNR
jgi:hypothetical protein